MCRCGVAVGVGVGVGVGGGPDCAQYLPPVFNSAAGGVDAAPDDHFTASPDCRVMYRTSGALVVLVAVQLFVLGLYLPPVFKKIV